ncbi:hypothetical protein AYI68_g1549 [Smittium mucronatum]|uniref:Uncharacterized protein n=1 Tax=Smittium mucronatum TaxID=133383 RepID=A0A1R0H582_9FUNG|nr:hypothetical protein AYI68_g1549 [Smittium mucronatum]
MPMSEEDRKTAICACPRTSSMNYTPPPLNDSASTAETFDALLASRKTDIRKRRVQPFRKSQQAALTLKIASSNVFKVRNSSAASVSIPNNSPQRNQQNFRGRGRGRENQQGFQWALLDAYKLNVNDAKSTTIQGQRSKQGNQKVSENWEDSSEELGELHRGGSSNFSCTVTQSPNVEEAHRAEEIFSGEIEMLENNCMGGSAWNQVLLWNMESLRGIDAYQCQGALDDIIRLITTESFREISTDLPRQYNLSGSRQEIWRHSIGQIAGNIGAYLDTLSSHKHSNSSCIRTVRPEPSGRTEQTYCPNQMVDIQRNCIDSEFPIRNPRCGSVCLATEQEGRGILLLIPRKQWPGSEFSSFQLVQMAENLRLPA